MPNGLYKGPLDSRYGEWVWLDWPIQEGAAFVTRDLYEARSYQPPYDELPTKEEYDARSNRPGSVT